TIWSVKPANGVSATARRARVFFRTRKYTPELRALLRNSVMLPTGRLRYSANTMAWARATSALTSATTACFCSRLRPKVFLLSKHDETTGVDRQQSHRHANHGDLIPGADMTSIPRVRRLRWASARNCAIKSPARDDAFDPNGL